MENVLFSAVGTTDPVRGEHDGPMLHIVRHYRPTTVYLFITAEIETMAEADGRFIKTASWIQEHWGGYCPKFQYIPCNVTNAYDIDALDGPISTAMNTISAAHPGAEILINVTSGTPQMQMLLSQLAMDTRYRTRGIQVRNFERSSGKTERTNSKGYDIELELELNEDELPEAENRCLEPEMYAVRREYMRRQVQTLLEHRNFEAVEMLQNFLPERPKKLIQHLAARSRLQSAEATRLASKIKFLSFNLYPYKAGNRSEYEKISEYYLLMRNLVMAGQYTEFILHMEPLTLQLQLALLNKYLAPYSVSTAAFITNNKGRLMFNPQQLSTAFPALYRHYVSMMDSRNWLIKTVDISTYVCNDLLLYFKDLPEQTKALFSHYDALKHIRNCLAHDLRTISPAEIKAACGVTAQDLLSEIESTIIKCYDACDPSIFHVYDKCIAFIAENM